MSGVLTGEVEKVVHAVLLLADASTEDISKRSFRADVREFVSTFEHIPLGRLDIGKLLREFFDKLRSHNLRCPPDIVLLIKALTTIESVAKDLDPEFDAMTFAEPYVKSLIERRYSFSAIRGRIERSFVEYAELAEVLPHELGELVRQLRQNKMTVTIEHRGLTRLTSTIEHSSRNVAFALVVSAMLVGSSILVLADRQGQAGGAFTIGIIGFASAYILILIRTFTNRRKKG